MDRLATAPFGAVLCLCVLALAGCGDDVMPPGMGTEGERLTGMVRQVATEVLVADVEVTVNGITTVSTPNGRYAFEGLAVGEVTLTATYPGFERYERRVRIREGSNTHNIPLIPIAPLQPAGRR